MKYFAMIYDTNYGCEKQTGWSVCIDGVYYSVFQRFLLVALVKGFYHWFRLCRSS